MPTSCVNLTLVTRSCRVGLAAIRIPLRKRARILPLLATIARAWTRTRSRIGGQPMVVVSDTDTPEQIAEALTHLAHKAGRVTVADDRHADLHHAIDDLLTAWEAAR